MQHRYFLILYNYYECLDLSLVLLVRWSWQDGVELPTHVLSHLAWL